MNYEEEKKRYVSFCGSYCRTCDWFTGKIRRTFQSALDMVEEYGFRKWLEGKVDIDNFKEALRILANASIDSGCKADIAKNPDDDRCKIRQCCFQKGFDLCNECSDFPCDLLKSNPGARALIMMLVQNPQYEQILSPYVIAAQAVSLGSLVIAFLDKVLDFLYACATEFRIHKLFIILRLS